ncbi:MAG TPA: hypothetical protein VKU60_04825, partial [Chloroflexota bacterium]|nr:hypothetical protein [Chloroflexota bacterium]
APRLPFEASVVLITAGFDEPLLAAATEIRRRRPLTIWHVKGPLAPDVHLPGLDVLTVPYDEHWQELDRLQLAA